MNKIIEQLKNIGFTDANTVDPKKLKAMHEIRDLCAANRCGAYNKNWSCPPHCGDIDFCQKSLQQYNNCIVMITVTPLEDSFDIENMEYASVRHQKLFFEAIDLFKKSYSDILPLGAGGCRICEKCSCPDSPCRFPEKRVTSMEAYGLLVSDVCAESGVSYFNGENTITYVSCILF